MIQKLIEKLNKKRLKERISSAIVMVGPDCQHFRCCGSRFRNYCQQPL